MKSFSDISTSLFYTLKERWVHPDLDAAWHACGDADGWSRERLEGCISSKLSALLRHAVLTVPFYRERVDPIKVQKGTLSLEDFPIISKRDIRGHEREFISDDYKAENLERLRTSGSTGEPFMFYRTKKSFDYTYATLWRGLLRFGIRPGQRRAFIKGIFETARPPFSERVRYGLKEFLNKCIFVDAHFLTLNDDNLHRSLKRILLYRPVYFHGYASTIYTLAQYAERNNIDCSVLQLTAVVTESEKCHAFQREAIERVFHAPVVENYGCVEFGMIAQPARDGQFCINEDHIKIETDPDGSAILTNLDEFGFPLIRFKNGDRVAIGEVHDELPYRTLTSVEGRIAETIHLPQGGVVHGYMVMYPISKHMKYLREYQVYQPDIDHLLIRIVESGFLPAQIAQQIIREMQTIVGTAMDVQIQRVASIPLTKRGKRTFVCSDVCAK